MAWPAPLWLLVGVTAPSYEGVYPSLATRTVLIEQMRKPPGVRLLYGYVPLPGRPDQLPWWETGTFLLVCTTFMTIPLTYRVLRAGKDGGLVEVLRATDAGRSAPSLIPVALVQMVIGALSAGAGGSLSQ